MLEGISYLCIVGPTAIGKTAVAMSIAQQINGEIISLDSRQIYNGMGIGTAQPSATELGAVPHHLVSIRKPNEPVSAGEYAQLVWDCIADIKSRSKKPIICGGAGLYLEALTKGIFTSSRADMNIRRRISTDYNRNPSRLMKKLVKIDPDYAEKVHPNNKKRLVRALEIYAITGIPPSIHFAEQSSIQPDKAQFLTILLAIDMESLTVRIRSRTNKMLNSGWIEETKNLRKNYSNQETHALDSIGYCQIDRYLDGEFSLEEATAEIILRTRQYAKRQLTWFRNRSNPIEIDVAKFEDVGAIAAEIISIWRRKERFPLK